MANLLYQSLQPGLDEDLFGADGAAFAAAAAVGLNSADDSLPYSTSELNAPEYSTDEFRMFQFKVARCSKRYVHDWRACPFAHPTENARRRDPRLVKYLPVPCPDYKRGICLRGDSCTYSHGVYECWLHPAKYRTQLCKEGPNCRRPVCFFAHSVLDLRQPTHMYDNQTSNGGAEDVANVAAALAAQQQAAAAAAAAVGGAAAAAAASRLSSDAAFQRLSSDEMLNNLQDGRSSVDVAVQQAAAALLASQAAPPAGAGSPGSRRQSASLTRTSSSSRGGANGAGSGSMSASPDRAGSPTTPSQPSLQDLPAQRSAEVPGASISDAAAAMAVLTQQQQAQAQAQAAAALARLSMDAGRGTSLDASSAAAAAAVASTQAMLQAQQQAGLPPRMSLDSLLATRTGAAAQQPGWAPGAVPPASTTVAAALAGSSSLPLNEQPFPSGNAPRMSNAVARKLGLAPQRTSLDARLSKLRSAGVVTPQRTSIDGILHALQQSSARSSLDQQAMLASLNQQQQLAMAAGLGGINGASQLPLNGSYGGAGLPPTAPNGYGAAMPNGAGMPGGATPDGVGLHPALLSLVAAQMAPQQAHPGMAGMPPPGVPNGMHSGLGAQHGGDPGMAALMESLNGWQLNGGAGMGHRASMDSMGGMAVPSGMAGAGGPPPAGPAAGNFYDAKGIWTASSQEAINNQAGSD